MVNILSRIRQSFVGGGRKGKRSHRGNTTTTTATPGSNEVRHDKALIAAVSGESDHQCAIVAHNYSSGEERSSNQTVWAESKAIGVPADDEEQRYHAQQPPTTMSTSRTDAGLANDRRRNFLDDSIVSAEPVPSSSNQASIFLSSSSVHSQDALIISTDSRDDETYANGLDVSSHDGDLLMSLRPSASSSTTKTDSVKFPKVVDSDRAMALDWSSQGEEEPEHIVVAWGYDEISDLSTMPPTLPQCTRDDASQQLSSRMVHETYPNITRSHGFVQSDGLAMAAAAPTSTLLRTQEPMIMENFQVGQTVAIVQGIHKKHGYVGKIERALNCYVEVRVQPNDLLLKVKKTSIILWGTTGGSTSLTTDTNDTRGLSKNSNTTFIGSQRNHPRPTSVAHSHRDGATDMDTTTPSVTGLGVMDTTRSNMLSSSSVSLPNDNADAETICPPTGSFVGSCGTDPLDRYYGAHSHDGTDLREGQVVSFVAGAYAGKNITGIVQKVTNIKVAVLLPNGKVTRVNQSSVTVWNGETSNPLGHVQPGMNHSIKRSSQPSAKIHTMDYHRTELVLSEPMPSLRTAAIARKGQALAKKTRKSNMQCSEYQLSKQEISRRSELWRILDGENGGARFGNRRIAKLRLASVKDENQDTFFAHFFYNRIHTVQIPLAKSGKFSACPFQEKVVISEGNTYELAAMKIQADGDLPTFCQYVKPQCAVLIFVEVSSPRVHPISLQEELSKLGDFAALSPQKAKARLELLQSPGCFKYFLKTDDLALIEGKGIDGCGFINEDLLISICGSNAAAKRALAIQVRIVAPKLGIFKGMLFRKRSITGPPIELSLSMRKVGPSRHPDSLDGAFLIVTKTGYHPHMINYYIGRHLDSGLRYPPRDFDQKLKKKGEMRDMIPRLWQELGVPRDICSRYAKNTTQRDHLKHAWVVGVADPTDALPSASIYVTGMGDLRGRNEYLFVTRSPCIKHTDGCLISVVGTKPDSMSEEDWQWLESLPFGAVVFANPNPGMTPMPALIAGGDLDGDLYFVCWDEDVLYHLRCDPLKEIPLDEVDANTKVSDSDNHDWLSKAQEIMLDLKASEDINELVCRLNKLASQSADKSDKFLADPIAEAFADAFKEALDIGKHGGKIYLPLNLHDSVPEHLRQYLVGEV